MLTLGLVHILFLDLQLVKSILMPQHLNLVHFPLHFCNGFSQTLGLYFTYRMFGVWEDTTVKVFNHIMDPGEVKNGLLHNILVETNINFSFHVNMWCRFRGEPEEEHDHGWVRFAGGHARCIPVASSARRNCGYDHPVFRSNTPSVQLPLAAGGIPNAVHASLPSSPGVFPVQHRVCRIFIRHMLSNCFLPSLSSKAEQVCKIYSHAILRF